MSGASLREVPARAIEKALRTSGLNIDLGSFAIRLTSDLPELATLLKRVYAHFPFSVEERFVDATARLFLSRGLRRLIGNQVRFEIEGVEPFEPFPRRLSLPLLEWGINWGFVHMSAQHLLLHAGVVEAHGVGLVLAASPGSGKSTLTGALTLSGARLLSDEFGVVSIEDLSLLPIPKPISLKNASIEVVGRWSRDAEFGPRCIGTRKGDIAHMVVDRSSVERRTTSAYPRVIVFPRWSENAPVQLEALDPGVAFAQVAMNSFNYALLGREGFLAVAGLLRRCCSYRLEYGQLQEAVPLLLRLCREASN